MIIKKNKKLSQIMICRYFVIIYEKAIKDDFFSYYLLLILTEISIKKAWEF